MSDTKSDSAADEKEKAAIAEEKAAAAEKRKTPAFQKRMKESFELHDKKVSTRFVALRRTVGRSLYGLGRYSPLLIV